MLTAPSSPARAGSRGRSPAARRAARRRASSARIRAGGAPARRADLRLSPPSAVGLGGSSMRDLISISIAAISRYSLASSRLCLADLLDVVEVLARDLRHRDVEDVEVLLAGSGTAAGPAGLRRSRGRPPARPAGCTDPSASGTAARRTGGPARRRRRCRASNRWRARQAQRRAAPARRRPRRRDSRA